MDAIELLQHDHRMVEQLMRDYHAAGGPPGGDSQRRGIVEVTVRELSKHAALEGTLFYPFAKEVLPDGEESLTEMGAVIDAGKSTAPTRPHPAAPDEPPLLPLAAPVVGIYDRLRDRIQGRPTT